MASFVTKLDGNKQLEHSQSRKLFLIFWLFLQKLRPWLWFPECLQDCQLGVCTSLSPFLCQKYLATSKFSFIFLSFFMLDTLFSLKNPWHSRHVVHYDVSFRNAFILHTWLVHAIQHLRIRFHGFSNSASCWLIFHSWNSILLYQNRQAWGKHYLKIDLQELLPKFFVR